MVRECKWRGSDELSIWMPWSQKRRFVWLCPNNRYSYLWVTKWRFLKCQRLSFVGWENKYTGIIVGSGAQISPIFLVFYPGVSVSSQYYFPPGSFWRSSPFLRIFNIFCSWECSHYNWFIITWFSLSPAACKPSYLKIGLSQYAKLTRWNPSLLIHMLSVSSVPTTSCRC